MALLRLSESGQLMELKDKWWSVPEDQKCPVIFVHVARLTNTGEIQLTSHNNDVSGTKRRFGRIRRQRSRRDVRHSYFRMSVRIYILSVGIPVEHSESGGRRKSNVALPSVNQTVHISYYARIFRVINFICRICNRIFLLLILFNVVQQLVVGPLTYYIYNVTRHACT